MRNVSGIELTDATCCIVCFGAYIWRRVVLFIAIVLVHWHTVYNKCTGDASYIVIIVCI